METKADGTWQGASVLNDLDWEDFPGGKNFFVSAVGFRIVDDSPTFRLYQAIYWYEGSNADAFCFNLSPLTIATPPSPTKSATITG